MPKYIVRLKIGQKEFNARTEAQDRFSAEMKARGAALRRFPGDSVTVVCTVPDCETLDEFKSAFDDVFGRIFKK